MRGNGKTNMFGQTILASDYGADDLNAYRDDTRLETGAPRVPGAATAVTSGSLVRGETSRVEALVVLLDGDAPAIDRERKYEVARPADFYEGGHAHWIGPDGVVSVPIEQIASFKAYLRCLRLSPIGRTLDVHLSMYVEEPYDIDFWSTVEAQVR